MTPYDTYLDIITKDKRISLDIRGSKLTSFMGASGHLYDIENPLYEPLSLDYITSSIESDPKWNLSWTMLSNENSKGIREGVIDAGYLYFWKFTDANELQIIFVKQDKWKRRNKIIEFYQYITRNYIPPDFFIIRFEYFPCPGYMTIRLIPRYVQLRAVVIENISSSPIHIGKFLLKKNTINRLRSR